MHITFSSDKRRLTSPLEQHNLESFYLNPKSSDIMFSVCDNILPAHRVLLETGSKSFYQRFESNITSPISLDRIETMLGEQLTETSNATTVTTEPLCPNNILLAAFRHFLQYFYQPKVELKDIADLETLYHLWRLADKYFVARPSVKSDIEQRFSEMINRSNLVSIYQFQQAHNVASIKAIWLNYVHDHINELFDLQQGKLNMSCKDEIKSDIKMLDDLVSAVATNQTTVITILSNLIHDCPQLPPIAQVLANGKNLFPNSLHYYNCSADDLEKLKNMKFITIENYANALAQRLKNKEREYQKLLMEKSAATSRQVPIYARPLPAPRHSHSDHRG